MNEILFTIPPAITAIITFFLTKRKYQVEVKGSEIDNLEKAVRIWRELTEDIKVRLEADIAELRLENRNMKEQLNMVLIENQKLTEKLTKFNKTYWGESINQG